MITYENQCVDCGLPCWGNSCPNRNVEVIKCDTCHDYAEYSIDDEDFCESCARKMLLHEFKGLTVLEQAEAVGLIAAKYM